MAEYGFHPDGTPMCGFVTATYKPSLYPRVEEVIVTETPRGAGTPEDPCRIVIQVFRKDGTFIAENDPCRSDSAPHDQKSDRP